MIEPLSTKENARLSNINRIAIGNLNVNSSFPTSQNLVDGFSEPFRLDRNRSGGEVIIYVRDDIPSKLPIKYFLIM